MRWVATVVLLGGAVGLRVGCDCGGHAPPDPVCLADVCGPASGEQDAAASSDGGTSTGGGTLPDGGTWAADGGPSCLDTGCGAGDSCCATDLSCHPTGCLACCPSIQ